MSLIEVLVGILLISFGLLGLISLMGRSVQFSVGAEDSQRAAQLASEMATTILLSNPNVLAPAATVAVPASDVAAWQIRVANAASGGLTNGVGNVAAAGNLARITIQWRPPQAASGAVNNYATTVVVP